LKDLKKLFLNSFFFYSKIRISPPKKPHPSFLFFPFIPIDSNKKKKKILFDTNKIIDFKL
jgi:hypothetical protein